MEHMYHNFNNVSTEEFGQLLDALNIGQFEPFCLVSKIAPHYFSRLISTHRPSNSRQNESPHQWLIQFVSLVNILASTPQTGNKSRSHCW